MVRTLLPFFPARYRSREGRCTAAHHNAQRIPLFRSLPAAAAGDPRECIEVGASVLAECSDVLRPPQRVFAGGYASGAKYSAKNVCMRLGNMSDHPPPLTLVVILLCFSGRKLDLVDAAQCRTLFRKDLSIPNSVP